MLQMLQCKLWLVTINKAWRFYVHSKSWKEKMKYHSKTLHYILSPNPKDEEIGRIETLSGDYHKSWCKNWFYKEIKTWKNQ
jgi:hypothetical protein